MCYIQSSTQYIGPVTGMVKCVTWLLKPCQKRCEMSDPKSIISNILLMRLVYTGAVGHLCKQLDPWLRFALRASRGCCNYNGGEGGNDVCLIRAKRWKDGWQSTGLSHKLPLFSLHWFSSVSPTQTWAAHPKKTDSCPRRVPAPRQSRGAHAHTTRPHGTDRIAF